MNMQFLSRPLMRPLFAGLLLATTFAACKKDRDEAPAKPAIDKVEVGLGNNEIGVIGKDFHLNAEVTAGFRIETVQIRIVQRSNETYAKPWSHEITYDQYKGARNATVHKHFDIPADAAEGRYDFLIIVNDQNGTRLEEKRTLSIYAEANLPVNPTLSLFNIMRTQVPGFYYRRGVFINPGEKLNKNDTLMMQVNMAGVKGDGKLYVLLINKKLNHKPETIDKIDFGKVIVYDVLEHKNLATTGDFSNVVFDDQTFATTRDMPRLAIGATTDNHVPAPNLIGGVKAWESGEYYIGVLYRNTTYNINFYRYIEAGINYN